MRLANILNRLAYGYYPINAIFITTDPTNPGEYLGGTWIAFGRGRTLVGVDPGDSDFNTVMKEIGEKTHTLSVQEMPSHSHPYNKVNTSTFKESGNTTQHTQVSSQSAVNTGSTGGGAAHNNIQPSITVYMWKRTA